MFEINDLRITCAISQVVFTHPYTNTKCRNLHPQYVCIHIQELDVRYFPVSVSVYLFLLYSAEINSSLHQKDNSANLPEWIIFFHHIPELIQNNPTVVLPGCHNHRLHKFLQHNKTIFDQNLAELPIITFILIGQCWKIKENYHSHKPKPTHISFSKTIHTIL